jgi:hypothetical protein
MKSTIYLWKRRAVLLTILLVGCEVTSEKIDRWKQSEKGAAKIRAALRDTGQKTPVRIEAAEALAEMGLFLPMAEDLKSLPAADRKKLSEELTRRLLVKMKGSNPKATTRVQLQAKDALFSLREVVEGHLVQIVDTEVLQWLLTDWQNRQGGEHSGEKIINAIRAPAGPIIAAHIADNPLLMVPLATLLRDVGEPAAREAAAEQLIEFAKKQNPLEMATLHALGKVGSLEGVAYLTTLASKGEVQHRLWALRALALFPQATIVSTMKTIAADTSLKEDDAILRDEAFTVMEKIDAPESLEALGSFLADKDEKVRYRAVEGILSGFKAKGLTKLLQSLPSSYTYKKQDIIDFIEEDIVKEVGQDALGPLREALNSKSWISKLVAVRGLGRLGLKEDVEALAKLANDSTPLRGWEGATIGSESNAAAEKIKSRK